MAHLRLIDPDDAQGQLAEEYAAAVGRAGKVFDDETLRAHGLDDAAIRDAIQVIAYFNCINRIPEGGGTDPEPEWATRARP